MLSLNDINEMKPWINSVKRCPSCKRQAKRFHINETGKKECSNCLHKRVADYLAGRDITGWTWNTFASSLSNSGSMADRLTALIHFEKFQTKKELPGLLIYNLGFVSGHPLDWFVRQKAVEITFQFNDRRKILSALLNSGQYNSWQQKANIMMAAYGINPSDSRVEELVRKMGQDSSPNVRKRVALLIKDNKKMWAKTLLNQLENDPNPLVRETFTENVKQNIRVPLQQRYKTKSKKRKKQQEVFYNEVEKLVKNNLNISKNYKKIYDLYLSHLPGLMDQKKYKKEQLNELKQNNEISCVRLIAAALTDKDLFAALIEKLPEFVVILLYVCTYELHEIDETMIGKKLLSFTNGDASYDDKTAVSDNNNIPAEKKASSDQVNMMKLHEIIKKDPALFLFKSRKKFLYGYDYSNFIFINYYFGSYIEKLLPLPDFIAIEPIQDISGRVDHIHENSQNILWQLPVILNFISQGHLKYNTAGSKILVASLKKMKKFCSMEEFYDDKDKEIVSLKTKILADFLNCMSPWKPRELKNIPDFIKKRLNLFFSFKDFTGFFCRDGLDHLKQKSDYYTSYDSEQLIRENFNKILKLLPGKKWVSVDQLARTAFYNGLDMNPFQNKYEFETLYIIMEGNSEYYSRVRAYLPCLFIFDAVILPLIKQMMFLFGAMGIVDLGYSSPENNFYQQYKKSWLTVFDGLKYVRLTDLGSYVTGRKKSFKSDVILKSSEIHMDSYKTILSIYEEDPIKKMILESMGKKINRSSYMVDSRSFLKNCGTARDVKDKIKFFRENISDRPPAVWEDFFKDILSRINPLHPVEDVVVFRIKHDRKLLSLLSTDPILKKYIIRAENYHIVVKSSDYSKIKKRLSLLGFFLS